MEGKGSVARRGRPPNVARRRAIVRAALGLFADYGFNGTAMRAVAEAAGIGEALLYRYYASKRELLDAVLVYVINEASAVADAYALAARTKSSLRCFLQDIGTAFLQHLDEMHPWYAMRLQSLPLDRQQRRAMLDAAERAFSVVARAIAERGTFHDPYVTARAFFGALMYQQMLQMRLRLDPGTPELRAIFLDQVIDLIAAGREGSLPRGDVRR